MNNRITWSVIVPCYNEEKRILKTIPELKIFLDNNPGSEVIFVDDGSTDATGFILSGIAERDNRIKTISLQKNRGKWGAVAVGFFNAQKDFSILVDADFSIDINSDSIKYILRNINCDSVIIGNRYSGNNVIPFKRHISGMVFNLLARKIVGIKYRDSQCPAKIWPNNKIMYGIFLNLIERGFAGDVEFLRRCDMFSVKVSSVIVDYKFVDGSSVNVVRHAPKMFGSLFHIRSNTRAKAL